MNVLEMSCIQKIQSRSPNYQYIMKSVDENAPAG
jgi:hypothetical protein